MMIRDMFADDINRKINGVIKVDQAADDVIEQELNEYVITRELKKHFITFFNYYGDAFDQPSAHSLTTTQRLSTSRLIKSACGFPASLEVVNLTF